VGTFLRKPPIRFQALVHLEEIRGAIPVDQGLDMAGLLRIPQTQGFQVRDTGGDAQHSSEMPSGRPSPGGNPVRVEGIRLRVPPHPAQSGIVPQCPPQS
jgi:hypothetical protein